MARRKQNREIKKLQKALTLLKECDYYHIEREDLVYTLRSLLRRMSVETDSMKKYLKQKLTELGEK